VEPDLFLKARRQARGWSLKDLSERSGVSVSHIARLERGERRPSLRIARMINDALALGLAGSLALGKTGDESFESLKLRYNLPVRLVESIRTVATTQKDKPLQVFDTPSPGNNYHIRIPFPEVTSLCPKTGQPDFATVTIDYVPDKVCVELKALKLYYNSYRNEGHFIEELANLILNDLVEALSPKWIMVEVHFHTRGGMDPIVRVKWRK